MKITVITGQTATGKTQRALDLARLNKGELINCDSRQIYTSLNIITGKDISPTSMFHSIQSIGSFDLGYYKDSASPIWLYDIVHPDKSFSAYDFKTCCVWVIKDIIQRGKTPILVGGTYFYLQHLLYNNVTTSIAQNEKLRKQLSTKSVAELQTELIKLNGSFFNKLNNSEKCNRHRLIRKIEIISSGHSIQPQELKGLLQQSVEESLSKILGQLVEIEMTGFRFKDKETMSKTIRDRVEKRVGEGGIDEVMTLLKKGYTEKSPGLQTIGYQQLIQYVKGNLTKEKAIEEWITKEIQYAKRQYTFMKKDKNINWREV